ncbi:hypothetical protein EDB82DRAFT_352982, partial [Fusarium venenatum]|uniref:uncharacterized protein n=1 Tax=Fusarium venenatum TaxID=56646 RepID=UPI001DC1A104
LASVCLIDGVSSCLGENVTTTNIWEFRECSAANASTHITEHRTDPTTTMGGSTQADTGPASSLDFGPSSTTTTTSSSE